MPRNDYVTYSVCLTGQVNTEIVRNQQADYNRRVVLNPVVQGTVDSTDDEKVHKTWCWDLNRVDHTLV